MSGYQAHETAIIDPGTTIGDGTRIWHCTHICSGAQIGKNCTLGQNVYVGGRAVIGDNVKIQNNVSVYDGVILEEGVFCGPSMVFTNVNNPRSLVNRMDELCTTRVQKGASLGANSTIICGASIGRHAFVGAGSVLTTDAPDYALMVGVPARQTGWLSEFGNKIPLPLQGDGTFVCPDTDQVYKLDKAGLRRID